MEPDDHASDGKNAEADFHHRLAELTRLTVELTHFMSFEELCLHAVEAGKSRLGFERFGVWLTTDDPTVIQGVFGVDENGELRDERSSRVTIAEGSAERRVLDGKLPSYRESGSSLFDGAENAIGVGTRLVAPLWDGERIIGFASVDNGLTGKPITEPNRELLVLYASTLGSLFSRAWARDEQRKLEEQMQHAQKLESLGVLAGGIAHDFNNLLVGILGHSDFVLQDLPSSSPCREDLEAIRSAALRASELTNQMLAYVGRGRFVVGRHDLNRIVSDVTHLLNVSVSAKTELITNLSESLSRVDGDASQIRQVVVSLVTNAAEAIPEGEHGLVSVSTHMHVVAEGQLNALTPGESLPEGLYVVLEVRDTGCGMEPECLKRLFEPFYTTKFTGRGLGLAAALGIVRGHKGSIEVRSTPGKGSTFSVYLPAAAETEPDERTETRADRADDPDTVCGTVLVIDDEEHMTRVAELLLKRRGFAVLTADDGRRGLEVFRQHASDIDAVVLDMTMPEMDGAETFKAIRALRSDVPIILTSGYDEEEAIARFGGGELSGFIQKPFRIDTLLRVVRGAIVRGGGVG